MRRANDQVAAAPLGRLRVVEMASYVTGPYACAILAEFGAEVIKVEEPQAGDPFRGWGRGGYSPTFRSVNRGKRSLAVDVRSAEGRDIVARLLERADVFVENYRPGVVDRLGFGYAEVARRNPQIVYCSISGFGRTGPYRDRPGYDTVGQAMSGLLSLLTDLEAPRPMGISLADHITGLYAAIGILAALSARALDGKGRFVETSLLQATTAFVAENAARFFEDGEVPTRATRARIAQAYTFVAGDGKPFVIHLSSPPKFWEALTEVVGRPELRVDARFIDRAARIRNYDALEAELAAVFRTRPRAEWLARLDAADVPAGPLYNLGEVAEDLGVQALGLIQEVVHPSAGPMRLIGAGVHLSGDEVEMKPPPLLGEDTEAVLRELGFGEADLTSLRDRGVVR